MEYSNGIFRGELEDESALTPTDRVKAGTLKAIRPSPLEFPKSIYHGSTPPLPIVHEETAIQDLKDEWEQEHRTADAHANDEHKQTVVIDLDNFSCYRPRNVRRPFELEILQNLHATIGVNELLFNGVLQYGASRRYVEGESFSIFSIEGYADGEEDPGEVTLYIQSTKGSQDDSYDIWYRLVNPAREYLGYYKAFHWAATFAKYFVDFLESRSQTELQHFKCEFYLWVKRKHGHHKTFSHWIEEFGQRDFRAAVNANIQFLYNETYNINTSLLSMPLWGDCLQRPELSSIEDRKIQNQKTVATPLVYDCFKDMYFGKCLQALTPGNEVQKARASRMADLHFAEEAPTPSAAISRDIASNPHIRPGDVVGIEPDEGSAWKEAKGTWLAYVQRTERLSSGEDQLFVLWLYRPQDTTISTMHYPIPNELFLSDNCNCDEKLLTSSDVVRKFSVEWEPATLGTDKEYLCRQKYATADSAFVTLQKTDFSCRCRQGKIQAAETSLLEHRSGDCVYIKKNNRLEPVVVVKLRNKAEEVVVRRLLRLREQLSELASSLRIVEAVAPNELVWSDHFETVSVKRLKRKCHIRYYSSDHAVHKKIPTPYDRGGTGDYWIVTARLIEDGPSRSLEPLQSPFPEQMNQGFDPEATSDFKPLNGLSMFSGGGNLDRGLEEGGAVKFRTVIDISGPAVHTQKANMRDPDDGKIYWGSVDDYNAARIYGHEMTPIARIGDVQFIAAGSPCPGFSLLQQDWRSEQSLRNASHLTSFCSAVDIYRPEYALLENVVTMAQVRKGFESENVFSQLIATLVSMSYQTQQFLVDSWSHGSCQQRSRLFVAIAAPGLVPLKSPALTHSHGAVVKGRAIGLLPNGEQFGSREEYITPFEMVTARQGVADLPDIGSSCIQSCIPFPDHRTTMKMMDNNRSLMKLIPTWPPQQGYRDAHRLDLVPPSLTKTKKDPGNSWKRIHPDRLFPTITTSVSPQDNRTGTTLHWNQHRVITIQDARRAQGIPDGEVIIGSPAEQYAVIGNAVERHVSLALGLQLRYAWEETSHSTTKEHDRASQRESTVVTERLSITKDKSVKRTRHSETTVDTVSILSERTVQTTRPIASAETTPIPVSFPLRTSRNPSGPISGASRERRRSPKVVIIIDDDPVEPRQPNVAVSGTLRKRPLETTAEEIDADSASAATKRTRHSGLGIEYTPKDWSKQVERTIQKG